MRIRSTIALSVLNQTLHLVAPRQEPAERPNAFAVSNFGFEPRSHRGSCRRPAFAAKCAPLSTGSDSPQAQLKPRGVLALRSGEMIL